MRHEEARPENTGEKRNARGRHPVLKRLAQGLPVTDEEFDLLLPSRLRPHSATHWTPVEAAVLASRLAAFKPGARVLDVGSGAGKFCIIGSITNPRATFHGVEQRGALVSAAKAFVREHAVPGATFTHAEASAVQWSRYDAVYFFNPFWEHMAEEKRIDNAIPLHAGKYLSDVMMAHARLRDLKPGARVVVLNGFGGEVPDGFTLLSEQRVAELELKVWERGAP